jgi:hypothetical protein
VLRVRRLAKDVARDEHKMHAYVRFREVAEGDGPRFIAWFEPQHHITLSVADFFVKRFAGMRWSIVTPEASLHWDGERLSTTEGGQRSDVPADDARDADWRAYYESTLIVALGVTALQSLSSHKGSLTSVRDETLKTREGQPMRATIHPSMLLRLPSEDDKEAEFARFVADLKKAKKLALAA